MISRWISLVPSPMIIRGVSRYSRSTPPSASWLAGPTMPMAATAASWAASDAYSLAMPASRSQRSARSFMPAAQYVMSRAASTRPAMWPSASGGASRSAARAAASSAARATPTARAAMLMRPVSSTDITCLKPRPSRPPTRLAAGQGNSSK